MKPVKITKPEPEVDVALVKFNKLEVVAEVKWISSLSEKELSEAEEKLLRFKDAKKFLVVPSEDALPRTVKPGIEVLSPEHVVKLVEGAASV